MQVPTLQRQVQAADVPIERLAGNPQLQESQKIAEASRQFEALLLRQILQDAQKPVIHTKFNTDSTASGIYRDMVTSHLADSISKSGEFGLAKTLQGQLSTELSTPSAKPETAAHAPTAGKTTTTASPSARPPHWPFEDSFHQYELRHQKPLTLPTALRAGDGASASTKTKRPIVRSSAPGRLPGASAISQTSTKSNPIAPARTAGQSQRAMPGHSQP